MKLLALLLYLAQGKGLTHKRVKQLYWTGADFPDDSDRGVLFHKCQKPTKPPSARDIVCHGPFCYVVCEKGAKVSGLKRIECRTGKGGKNFWWSKRGQLGSCVSCDPLSKPGNDVNEQCHFRGAWGNKVCNYRCSNDNHFLSASDGANKKTKNYTCRCPFVSGKRKCKWTTVSDYKEIFPDPASFTCTQPNHRLKCSQKPKQCTQLEHLNGEKYGTQLQVWIENRYQCRNCLNLKIKYPKFDQQDGRDFLEVQFTAEVVATQTVNHPVKEIENLGLNAFRIHFAEDANDFMEGQNVDITAEFRALGEAQPEVLAAFYCPCSVPRGITAPTKFVVQSELVVETSINFHPNLTEKETRLYALESAKLINSLNQLQHYQIRSIDFEPKAVSADNPLEPTTDPNSRCMQSFADKEGVECVRWENKFKCTRPATGVEVCEYVKNGGCGDMPAFAKYCGSTTVKQCNQIDDWSEAGCRKGGEFEEWESCAQWSNTINAEACLTQATIIIRTLFDEKEVTEFVFGNKNVRNYESALKRMHDIAVSEIRNRFDQVASWPVNPYGNVVLGPADLQDAYQFIHRDVRRPHLIGADYELNNVYDRFSAECPTCDPLAVCMPTNTGLNVASVVCECDTGYRFVEETKQCVNIDECSETNICHPEAFCEDSEGSFSCTCPSFMIGDGFQCNIPDQSVEIAEQTMVRKANSVNRGRRDTDFWSRQSCPNGGRREVCDDEPHCCFKSTSECDCRGIPMNNGKQMQSYVASIFMDQLKEQQSVNCENAQTYKDIEDLNTCGLPEPSLPSLELFNFRGLDFWDPKWKNPNFDIDFDLGNIDWSAKLKGICDILKFAFRMHFDSVGGIAAEAIGECKTVFKFILQPIMLAFSMDVGFELPKFPSFSEIKNWLLQALQGFFNFGQMNLDMFATNIKDINFPCPATMLNLDMKMNVLEAIAKLFEFIRDMIEATKAIGEAMREQYEMIKKMAEDLVECEWTNLYAINLNIDLPLFGELIKGQGLYVTYNWKYNEEKDRYRQQILEVGFFESIGSATKTSVLKGEIDKNQKAAKVNIDASADLEVKVLQGNKEVWGGWTQSIGLQQSLPAKGFNLINGLSLVFSSDCNDNHKLGNLLGVAFKIGAGLMKGQPQPKIDFTTSCGYVKAQAITQQIQNADGSYSGNMANVWDGGLEGCDQFPNEQQKNQCIADYDEKQRKANEKCPKKDIDTMMANAEQSAKRNSCILKEKGKEFASEAKKCGAIYGCQAKMCVDTIKDKFGKVKDAAVELLKCTPEFSDACPLWGPASSKPPSKNCDGSAECTCEYLTKFTRHGPGYLMGAATSCFNSLTGSKATKTATELVKCGLEAPLENLQIGSLEDLYNMVLNFDDTVTALIDMAGTGAQVTDALLNIGFNAIQKIPVIGKVFGKVTGVIDKMTKMFDVCGRQTKSAIETAYEEACGQADNKNECDKEAHKNQIRDGVCGPGWVRHQITGLPGVRCFKKMDDQDASDARGYCKGFKTGDKSAQLPNPKGETDNFEYTMMARALGIKRGAMLGLASWNNWRNWYGNEGSQKGTARLRVDLKGKWDKASGDCSDELYRYRQYPDSFESFTDKNSHKREKKQYRYYMFVGRIYQQEGEDGDPIFLGKFNNDKTTQYSKLGLNTITRYYTGGKKCGNSNRSVTVKVKCGSKNRIIHADEPSTCRYELTVTVKCGCEVMCMAGLGECDSVETKKTSPKSLGSFNPEGANYKYWITSSGKVMQKQNKKRNPGEWTIGKFESADYWEESDMVIRRYRNGEECSNGVKRKANLYLACGEKTEIKMVTEPWDCFYRISATVVCCERQITGSPELNAALTAVGLPGGRKRRESEDMDEIIKFEFDQNPNVTFSNESRHEMENEFKFEMMMGFPFGAKVTRTGLGARTSIVSNTHAIFKNCVDKYGEQWLKFIAGAGGAAKDFLISGAKDVWAATSGLASELGQVAAQAFNKAIDAFKEGGQALLNFGSSAFKKVFGRRRRSDDQSGLEPTFEDLINDEYLTEEEWRQGLADKRIGPQNRTVAELRLRLDVLSAMVSDGNFTSMLGIKEKVEEVEHVSLARAGVQTRSGLWKSICRIADSAWECTAGSLDQCFNYEDFAGLASTAKDLKDKCAFYNMLLFPSVECMKKAYEAPDKTNADFSKC